MTGTALKTRRIQLPFAAVDKNCILCQRIKGMEMLSGLYALLPHSLEKKDSFAHIPIRRCHASCRSRRLAAFGAV